MRAVVLAAGQSDASLIALARNRKPSDLKVLTERRTALQ
jgi:hypothetical protein